MFSAATEHKLQVFDEHISGVSALKARLLTAPCSWYDADLSLDLALGTQILHLAIASPYFFTFFLVVAVVFFNSINRIKLVFGWRSNGKA